ncbi:MAG: hypothetical protein ABIN61_02450 [candidate division WOR-3 bacterium]
MEFKCPQCDGVLKLEKHAGLVSCPYCGTYLYYEREKIILRKLIKPILDPTPAKILLKNKIKKDLNLKLTYLPFYRILTKEGVKFLPGEDIKLIGLEHFVPRGDIIPLDFDLPPPQKPSEAILKEKEIKEIESIEIIYYPFFKAEEALNIYYIDAVKGEIFTNFFEEIEEKPRNQYPFAIGSSIIVVFISLFLPSLILKIIFGLLLTLILWYYDRRENS